MAIIDVHSFGFTYPGAQRPAVRGVSFAVESREIFGFLGPSGAGKSTTQNPFPSLLAIAIVAGLSAPLLALVLAVAAPNKVAGFAAVKVMNAVNLLPAIAYFVPIPLQFLAGILPTYWPMRALWSAAAGEPYVVHLLIGGTVAGGALVVAARLFDRRLLRRG